MTITYGRVRASVHASPRQADTTPIRLCLLPQEVMGLAGRRGLTVRCQAGEVWLTQQGDAADRLLLAGDCFVSGGRGRVVLQALSDAVVSVS